MVYKKNYGKLTTEEKNSRPYAIRLPNDFPVTMPQLKYMISNIEKFLPKSNADEKTVIVWESLVAYLSARRESDDANRSRNTTIPTNN